MMDDEGYSREQLLVIIERMRKIIGEQNKELHILRTIDVKGWKGTDNIDIIFYDTYYVVRTRQKDKKTKEIRIIANKIPLSNVIAMRNILKRAMPPGITEVPIREVWRHTIYWYNLPLKLDEFNGGRNRSKYYFPLYYYPIKILEHYNEIDYGARTISIHVEGEDGTEFRYETEEEYEDNWRHDKELGVNGIEEG